MGLLGGAVRSECWWCSETGKASPVGGGEKEGSDLVRKPTGSLPHHPAPCDQRAQPIAQGALNVWAGVPLEWLEPQVLGGCSMGRERLVSPRPFCSGFRRPKRGSYSNLGVCLWLHGPESQGMPDS